MINEDVIGSFNSRLTANLNSIKTMTPAQADRVKNLGTAAENLLKNKDFALFIHSYKFEVCDVLSEITTHTEDANRERVALVNRLNGIDDFISSLKRTVYLKDRVVSQQMAPTEQTGEMNG